MFNFDTFCAVPVAIVVLTTVVIVVQYFRYRRLKERKNRGIIRHIREEERLVRELEQLRDDHEQQRNGCKNH